MKLKTSITDGLLSLFALCVEAKEAQQIMESAEEDITICLALKTTFR